MSGASPPLPAGGALLCHSLVGLGEPHPGSPLQPFSSGLGLGGPEFSLWSVWL